MACRALDPPRVRAVLYCSSSEGKEHHKSGWGGRRKLVIVYL